VKNILGLVRQQIKDARKEEGKDIIKVRHPNTHHELVIPV
jgi:hypothetical protein